METLICMFIWALYNMQGVSSATGQNFSGFFLLLKFRLGSNSSLKEIKAK